MKLEKTIGMENVVLSVKEMPTLKSTIGLNKPFLTSNIRHRNRTENLLETKRQIKSSQKELFYEFQSALILY